jgi:hypothetical protein
MADTFALIKSVTVGSGGSTSLEFTSIPSTYTDLLFKISARITRSGYVGDIMNVSFNGSSTNEKCRRIEGAGSGSVISASNSLLLAYQGSTTDATASIFGNGEFYIPNYASSNLKSASNDGVSENNGTTSYSGMAANLWSDTSAITSVTFTPDSGSNFVQYSTIYMYGIKSS